MQLLEANVVRACYVSKGRLDGSVGGNQHILSNVLGHKFLGLVATVMPTRFQFGTWRTLVRQTAYQMTWFFQALMGIS